MSVRDVHQRDRTVFDRLRQLQALLPAMATETAIARQEAARLRLENARLLERLHTAVPPTASGRSSNGRR